MKKGFSLIELMIVIVIIGVVYTLAITKLKNYGEEKTPPSFSNLKEYLLSFMEPDSSYVKMVCLDDCSECSVYVDETKTASFESWFDDSVESYTYTMQNGLVDKREDVFFNSENVQESVCFSFEVGRDSVAEQLIVFYKDRAYDYSNYFDKTMTFDSIEYAAEEREKLEQEIMR